METNNILKQLEKRNRELSIIWNLSRGAQRNLSFQEVIDAALEGVRTAVEPDMVLFYLKENDDLCFAATFRQMQKV